VNFEVKIDKEKCKACGYCMAACMQAVLEMSKNLNRKGYHFPAPVRIEACIGCQKCTVMCPDTAITISRKQSSKSSKPNHAEKK